MVPEDKGTSGGLPARAAVARDHAVYRALSYRFTLACDDDALARQAATVLGALREEDGRAAVAAPVPHYELRRAAAAAGRSAGPAALDLWRDGAPVARNQRPGDALGQVVWDVNRSAAEASGHHLLFHAAALEANGAGILLPGASGSGKSTLAAGLAQAGLRYLTDELAALDMRNGLLHPYPKPITVKPGSFAVLAHLEPRDGGARAPWAGTGWTGVEWQVPVGGETDRRVGRPCPPRYVLVPRYEAAAPAALVPLSETEAFFALALHAVNLLPHGADGTAAVGAVVAEATCASLTFSDLDEACALVMALVDDGGTAGSEVQARAV